MPQIAPLNWLNLFIIIIIIIITIRILNYFIYNNKIKKTVIKKKIKNNWKW